MHGKLCDRLSRLQSHLRFEDREQLCLVRFPGIAPVIGENIAGIPLTDLSEIPGRPEMTRTKENACLQRGAFYTQRQDFHKDGLELNADSYISSTLQLTGKTMGMTTSKRRIYFLLFTLIGVASVLRCRPVVAFVPNAVDEKQFVSIGGIEQWVTIEGQDRKNPVLLLLHGGPGAAMSPFDASLFSQWRQKFTVVQWDQRGAGRTYTKNGGVAIAPTMTIDRMVKDGLELSEFLAKHLQKETIILVGSSWGSILGIYMTKARPDLFCATSERPRSSIVSRGSWQATIV